MAKDPNVDIAEARAFLDAHPEWPATARIQAFVESRMDDDDPTSAILDFFSVREPRTGDGKIQLARAYLAAGRRDEATALIRDAWINHNFTVSEERRIIAAYGARLTKADHAARIDRLLWDIQVTNARRTFPYLSKKDRRMAEARAALLLRAASAPRLYRNLPKEEQLDSGVLHAAVRYYRRTDEQQYAIALAAEAPANAGDLRNTDRWWTERRLLMQWALKEGRFADAYQVAAEHGGAEGTDFSDAEFVAGWIALRFLGEAERARTHFEAMTGAVATPISLSRGYYWLGRAAAAAGDSAAAQGYYREAANHHYSFYGQLAAEELGGEAVNRPFAAPTTASPADKALFNSRPGVAALRMLSDLDLDYEFMVFAYHVDDQLERPGEYVELAKLANGEGAPHLTVRAGKVATQRGAFAADVSYPTVFVPDEARAFVSPEIILGLSRQESEFNPRAYSRAGARGMMQLIPSTAQITARKEGLPYRRSALLDDPVYNMTIGSAHLSHLLDRFGGSLIMTFAAYNAGAHRVSQWTEDFGDPRTGDVDPVDWIELIPFSETRNYVQRVLENTQVYRARLNDSAIPGRLAADIERGAPKGRIASGPPSARLTSRAASLGDAGQLSPLPARTARLAAEFREQRLAALAPALETPAPTNNAAGALQEPQPRLTTPPPAAAPAPSATPDAERPPAGGEPVAPAPIALETQATSEPPKTQNVIPAEEPRPAPDPAPPAVTALPEAASSAQTAPAVSAAGVPETDEGDRAFAERIIEKASGRLDIVDEGDALADAIVRGLHALEAEEAGLAAPPPDAALGQDDACAVDDADADAADLNARMTARLRGEDVCVE